MVQFVNVKVMLDRAKKVLERSGVKSKVLTSNSKKELEIKCCNLDLGVARPTDIYHSALEVLSQRGYEAKKHVVYDGKNISLSPIALEVIKNEFEPSLTYPQQV